MLTPRGFHLQIYNKIFETSNNSVVFFYDKTRLFAGLVCLTALKTTFNIVKTYFRIILNIFKMCG